MTWSVLGVFLASNESSSIHGDLIRISDGKISSRYLV